MYRESGKGSDLITPKEINDAIAAAWPAADGRCVDVSTEQATALFRPGPDAIRPGGLISGPTLFTAADAALWYLVFGATERVEPLAVTSELSIRYLRPAVGETIHARATLNRKTRRTVVGTVTVWIDDKEHEPCAVAQGTYVVPSS